MLERFDFVATLPAADIERAKAWYRDKLRLEPLEEHEGAVMYRAGSSTFQLYPTQHAGTARNTLGACTRTTSRPWSGSFVPGAWSSRSTTSPG